MLEIVINARRAPISEGLEVRRILPFRQKRMVGPFIFADHAGPMESYALDAPSPDVLPHPHIGLATVSYLFNGNITHRDSLGVEQIIEPGEVNWMIAGKGISHSERFEDPKVLAAGGFEMMQTWVALPTQFEENDPSFKNYKRSALPEFTDTGVWMKLIAGNAYGLSNHVQTLSPMHYLHVELQAGTRLPLPKEHSERGIYIVKGDIEFGAHTYTVGQMLVFTKESEPTILAKTNATVMLLGGDPLGERFIWWNFVASSRERIEQAKADWKSGRIILPPNDDQEFVPLPKDVGRPASSRPEPQPLS